MRVMGLATVPEPAAVSTVVPRESVKTPAPLIETKFPFASLPLPIPVPEPIGTLDFPPPAVVAKAEVLPIAWKVKPDPSVAVLTKEGLNEDTDS